MDKAFGTKFIIVNDVIQQLDPKIFQGGPWYHLATVKRGLKEYMAFTRGRVLDASVKAKPNEVWVEEIDPHTIALNKIKDDSEWQDVVNFLRDTKLLEIGNRRETHIDHALIKNHKN